MKKLLLLCTLFPTFIFAQTWSDDVASIVYNKCTKCHNTGGIAPFPLSTYNEVSPMASAIYDAISQDRMPPWPPSNTYNQYVHDRSLSATEKTTLQNWLLNGTPEGNSANTPPPPVFSSGSILGAGDLTVKIPNYLSKATAQNDDYVCFALPSGLAQNRIIKSIEIIPGNRQIVHHALIYADPTGTSVTDTVGSNCAGPSSSSATLLMGYTPGASPMTLPSGTSLKLGMTLQANSQILFAMHYPAGSFGQLDSTKVIFHFYPPGESGVRQVTAAPILQNWSFNLPANQITNVNAQYPNTGGLPTNISLLSVFPHMHLLGESMRVYGIPPVGDTLKLIHIPHWDFHWQDFYFFKHIQKLPTGTVLKANGVFNNTTGNTHNPNNPPLNVSAGLNTTDEMFLTYMHYMNYQTGDENFDMEALMNESLMQISEEENEYSEIKVFPNPFESSTQIQLPDFAVNGSVNACIYDVQGNRIKQLVKTNYLDQPQINWNGTNDQNESVSKGIYFVSVNINGVFYTKRVFKY